MNTDRLKDYVIDHFPNNRTLKGMAAKQKVRSLEKYLIPTRLLEEGERDTAKKAMIVEAYSKKWPKRRAFTDKRVEQTIQSSPLYKNRQDLDDVRTDMRFCFFAYGFLPEEYTYFLLESKPMEERLQYISDIQKKICVFKMNDFIDMQMFKDKERTYQFFKPYYNRDALAISKPSDYDAFSRFLEKHPRFVKKPINLDMGKGVELICLDECGKTKEQLFDLFIKRGKHIIEEPIRQSKETEQFNSSSVNSVRLFTFNTKEGVKYPFAFFRTGRKGSFVDNAGAKGVFAAVDMESGVLCTDGMDEDGREYLCHPESGVPYKGFQLPDWQGLVNRCTMLANMIPSVKYIGWDMAYTDNGWIIVEANRGGQPVMQGPLHHGVRQIYEEMMTKMDLMY